CPLLTLFPYTTLFRSIDLAVFARAIERDMNYPATAFLGATLSAKIHRLVRGHAQQPCLKRTLSLKGCQVSHHRKEGLLANLFRRSEEHTSELQSLAYL